MNRAQKAVLAVYVVAVLILGFLWVPWNREPAGPTGVSFPEGYGPIFEPVARGRVDASRVAVELAALTLAAGGLVLIFRED